MACQRRDLKVSLLVERGFEAACVISHVSETFKRSDEERRSMSNFAQLWSMRSGRLVAVPSISHVRATHFFNRSSCVTFRGHSSHPQRHRNLFNHMFQKYQVFSRPLPNSQLRCHCHGNQVTHVTLSRWHPIASLTIVFSSWQSVIGLFPSFSPVQSLLLHFRMLELPVDYIFPI